MSTPIRNNIFAELTHLLAFILKETREFDLHQILPGARTQFFRKKGKTIIEDHFFETRMCLFEEWFLLERPVVQNQTPAEVLVRNQLRRHNPEKMRKIILMANSHNSVFEILSNWKKDNFYVRDILYGSDWHIHHHPPFATIEPGQFFEGRLVNFTGENRLFPGIIVYPTLIKEEIDSLTTFLTARGFKKRQIIDLLSKLLIKAHRYSHLKIKRFFNPSDPMVKVELDHVLEFKE
ncbi:MAG: hypothetical protein PF689_13620 [Deltaproteobacteria bacterium]|nr:hypothetical protein [Deltaproteobacteria bacterium]